MFNGLLCLVYRGLVKSKNFAVQTGSLDDYTVYRGAPSVSINRRVPLMRRSGDVVRRLIILDLIDRGDREETATCGDLSTHALPLRHDHCPAR